MLLPPHYQPFLILAVVYIIHCTHHKQQDLRQISPFFIPSIHFMREKVPTLLVGLRRFTTHFNSEERPFGHPKCFTIISSVKHHSAILQTRSVPKLGSLEQSWPLSQLGFIAIRVILIFLERGESR